MLKKEVCVPEASKEDMKLNTKMARRMQQKDIEWQRVESVRVVVPAPRTVTLFTFALTKFRNSIERYNLLKDDCYRRRERERHVF